MRVIIQAEALRRSEKTHHHQFIHELPTIVAVPLVHGRWRINKQFADYECSECGQGDIISPYFKRLKLNYCPNCGAKMDGGAEG